MRYVSGFISLIFVTLLMLFASSNQEEAKLELWPLPQQFTAPLYLIAFIMIFAGFVLGGLAAWNAGRRHRRNAKQANKRVQILEGDLATMRSRAEAAEERVAGLIATRTEPAQELENPELI